MQVSHETIYRALYVQGRGALKRELTRHLRRGRSRRYARSQSSKRSGQGKLTEMVMISERPPEVEDRAVPGHWEGDLLMGNRQSPAAIATLVERSTRYLQLVALEGTEAERVADALGRVDHHPAGSASAFAHLGQGHEMAEHRRFSVESGVEVYFCDPQSPWQRGSNENTNGLLRQYFPQAPEPRGGDPGPARRGRRQAQPPTAKDARLPHSGGEARRVDRRPRGGRRRALSFASAYGLRSTALGSRWDDGLRQGGALTG